MSKASVTRATAVVAYAVIAGILQVSCGSIREKWEELDVVRSAYAAPMAGLQVFIRDEALHDPNHSQPRIYLKNTSTSQSVSNFRVHYYFTVENGGTPALGVYWAPGSQVSMQQVQGSIWRVEYDFNGTTLAPGQIVPDPSGNVIGLNNTSYTGWNEGNDWSAYGVTSTFKQTNRVVVVAANGDLLYGQLPPQLPPPGDPGSTGPSTSGSTTSSTTTTTVASTSASGTSATTTTSSTSSTETEGETGSEEGFIVTFRIKHPHQLRREDIALGTTGGDLAVNDDVRVLGMFSSHSSISAVDGGKVSRLGVGAEAWHVYGEQVTIADDAQVFGDVVGGSFVIADSADVLGDELPGVSFDPLRVIEWDVAFPTVVPPEVTTQPETSLSLPPGDYGSTKIERGVQLTLFPGTYTFDKLIAEPDSVFNIQNAEGPVFLYVRKDFTFRGIQNLEVDQANVLLGAAGATKTLIERAWSGIVVVPNAELELATLAVGDYYSGALFAKRLVVQPHTDLLHQPFSPASFCDGDEECSSFCPCEEGEECKTGVVGACADDLVCAVVSQDDGICAPTACTNSQGELQCGPGCPCGSDVGCQSDDDCEEGRICVAGWGTFFNQPKGSAACVPPTCLIDMEGSDCRLPPEACNSDDDCGPFGACSASASVAFGLNQPKTCWSTYCEDPGFACGNATALCGECQCEGSCSHVNSCGDGLFNGCDGLCPSVCASGEVGCNYDVDCPANHSCMAKAGVYFGGSPSEGACVPNQCLSSVSPEDCASTDAVCGTFCGGLASEPCADRECGVAPQSGVACGVCESGSTCGFDGMCSRAAQQSSPIKYVRAGTDEVGTIAASSGVSPTGKFTYSIPLKLPPGAGGLAPSLGLRFQDEANVRGPLGPGWAIEGLSRIHRCSPVSLQVEHHRPQSSLPEGICLDGKVLLESGDDSEYRVDDAPAVRVVRQGNDPDLGEGTWFQVFQPNGTVHTYGEYDTTRSLAARATDGDLDMTAVGQWAIENSVDRFGNRITYRYAGSSGRWTPSELNPTEIYYSYRHVFGNLLDTPARRVRFIYTTKEDSMGDAIGYRFRVPQSDNKLLSRVVIDTYDPSLSSEAEGYELLEARSYELEYAPAPISQLQMLRSITECNRGSDLQSHCLPPTSFAYDDTVKEVDGAPVWGDVNRFSAGQDEVVPGLPAPAALNFKTPKARPYRAIVFDADGDGNKEILRQTNPPFKLYDPTYVWSKANSANGFTYGPPVEAEYEGVGYACLDSSGVGDIDHDGRDELLNQCSFGHRDTIQYLTYEGGVLRGIDTSIPALAPAYLADINGDGLLDVVQESGAYLLVSLFHSIIDGQAIFSNYKVAALGEPSPLEPCGFWNQNENSIEQGMQLVHPLLIDVDGDGIGNLLRFDAASGEFRALRIVPSEELTDDEEEYAEDLLSESCKLYNPNCAPLGKGALALNLIGRWESTGLAFRQSDGDGRAASERLRILDVNADGLPDVLNSAIVSLTPMTSDSLCGDLTWYERNIGLKEVCEGAPIGYGAILDSGQVPLEYGEPAEMWINQGGTFARKQVLSNVDWRPESHCTEKSEDGHCATWFSATLFPFSAVMDYDHDGKEDLVTLDPVSSEEVHWSVVRFNSNGSDVLVDIDPIGVLPNASKHYFQVQDFARRALFYPLWSDLNGDSELDVLFTGAAPQDQRLHLGMNNKKGQRMTEVTDGLGNKILVARAAGTAVAEVGSGCEFREDEHPALAPHRCLSTVGKLVQLTAVANSVGDTLQTTKYSYHKPRSAAFQRGAQFVERRSFVFADDIDEDEAPVETVIETFGNLSPGTGLYQLGPSGWQYPFAGTPTNRTTKYGKASDILGGEFSREITEDYEFEVFAKPAPVLSEKRVTILDAISDSDLGETMSTLETYTYQGDDALPQTKVTDTFVAGRDDPSERISHVREYWNYQDYGDGAWILSDVSVHSVTSERNGFERTPTHQSSVYDLTSRRLVRRVDYLGDGLNLQTNYVFDDYGNLREEVKQDLSDPELPTRRTFTEYGERGLFPELIQNAEGHITSLRFDDLSGQPAVKVDSNGYRTETVYDGLGRMVKTINVDGETSVRYADADPVEVDGFVLPVRYSRVVTRGFAAPETEYFDSRGHTLQKDVPGLGTEGRTPRLFAETLWDWRGRVERQSAPHEAGVDPIWKTTRYDDWGRVRQIDGPLGTTNYRYSSIARFGDLIEDWAFPDAVGVLVEEDSEGYQAAKVLGIDGEPVATADGVNIGGGNVDTGFTTRIVRGGLGLPVAIVDPEGLEIVNSYSDVGWLKTRQDLDRGLLTNLYNAFGEVTTIVRPGTSAATLTYDRLGRMTHRSDADGATTWTYDSAEGSGIGKIASTTSPFDVQVTYSYEELPRGLLRETTHLTESQSYKPLVAKTGFEYDDFGRLIRTTYPVVPGFELIAETKYDPHSGGVVEVGSLDGSEPWWRATDVDTRGRIKDVELGNGTQQEFGYHPGSQLLESITYSSANNDTLGSVALTHYANGLLHEREVEAGDVERSRTVSYDANRRVHVVDETGDDAKSEEFQFSPNGRLLFRSSLGNYSYDDVDHPRAVTGTGDTEFDYDVRGNQNLRSGDLVEGGEQRVTAYSAFDLPLGLSIGADEEEPAASYAFSYDANQKRVVSLEQVSGKKTFIAGSAYEQTSTDEGVTHKFRVFVNGTAVAEIHYTEGETAASTVYLHRDNAGSVLFTSDEDGEPSDLRDFDVYGAPTSKPTWSDLVSDSFTSHRFEPGLGLIDMGARFYDPFVGVFTTADPLTVSGSGSQGTNPFAYANNDPVNLFDPLGLQASEASVSDSVLVTVYGAPLYPTLDLWVVPPPVSFDPNYPLQEYYTYNSPGQSLVVCDMSGQCSGGSLGSTLLAPRGDTYTTNGRRFQLTMGKLAVALFPIPVVEINTAMDSNQSVAVRLGATAIAVISLIPGGKVVDGAGDMVRAVRATDLGLSGKGVAELTGTVVEAGGTRIVSVDMIKAADSAIIPPSEIKGAVGAMIESARADGVKVLQIDASFANQRLQDFVFDQAGRFGGIAGSSGGRDVITFTLGAF